MKNQYQPHPAETVPAFSCISVPLHALIDRVQARFLEEASHKNSFILNEVDENICVTADEDILAFVLGCMISNAVCSTSGSCIRVETVSQDNRIQIVLRNNGKFAYSPGMHSLVTVSGAARKLGGVISLQSEPRGGFTVVLSLSAAA